MQNWRIEIVYSLNLIPLNHSIEERDNDLWRYYYKFLLDTINFILRTLFFIWF